MIRTGRAAAAVAALAVLSGIAVAWHASTTRASDQRPLMMPATFLTLPVKLPNFASDPSFVTRVAEQVDGAAAAGATYSGRLGGQTGTTFINIVATRADTSGKLDLNLAGDNGQRFGNVRCTITIVLRYPGKDDGKPAADLPQLPGKLLCWRTSKHLSVTAFAVLHPPAAAEVAAAVDTLFVSLR